MAQDDDGPGCVGVLMVLAVAAAVVAAIVMVIMATLFIGAIFGSGVGLVNYVKALFANVSTEKPRTT